MTVSFAQTLRDFMDRVPCGPDVLANLTGIPRSTIIHWLKEEGKKPRDWRRVVAVADALRLSKTDATALLRSAGHRSLAELLAGVDNEKDWGLLARWAAVPPQQQFATLPLDVLPAPAPLPPGSRMPLSRNRLFVGREVELRTLATTLKDGHTAAVAQIVAATGLGGIGKTQLASEFVHRYGQYFLGGVYWLSFAQPSSVPAEIAACGGGGCLDLRPDFDALPIKEQVRLVLAAWQSPVPRLLIFDNCEEENLLHQWRPATGGCCILVTSRRAQWDVSLGVQLLSLNVLRRKESIAVLRNFRPDLPADDPNLDAIAADLGHLPLALHLAGSYLSRYGHSVTPAVYLANLRSSAILHHRSMQGEGISPTDHNQHVARTFALSYNQLVGANTIDALAIALLARAAYFAPGELIPRDLLLATLSESADIEEVATALGRLLELGLLELIDSPRETAFRMHRLLVVFVRDVISDTTAQSNVEEALLATARKLNATRANMEFLAFQSLLRAATDAAISRSDELAAHLSYELGQHLTEIEDFVGSIQYNRCSLSIRTALFGGEHPTIIDNLNLMGWILQVQWRNYSEAQTYHEQALEIARNMLGEHHPTTAETLNYLGTVLHAQDRYTKAQPYYQEALTIRERELGKDDISTAQSLGNLGLLLHAMGQYAAALRYHTRALSIRERLLGPNHPTVAFSLNSLGYLLRAMGRYAEARQYLERALDVREQALGPNNSYVATTLNHLGRLLHYAGDYASARPYLERALAIYEHALGSDNPAVGHMLGNLGMLFLDQGDYSTARPYLEQALKIHQEAYGKDDRNTARSLNHLGIVLYVQGKLAEAQALLERALVTRMRILGEKHPDTGNSLGNLGILFLDRGETLAAGEYIQKALMIHQELLGDTHPYTARSLDRMGRLHRVQRDYDRAQIYLTKALNVYEQELGSDHPFTAICRGHLAELYLDRGNLLAK